MVAKKHPVAVQAAGEAPTTPGGTSKSFSARMRGLASSFSASFKGKRQKVVADDDDDAHLPRPHYANKKRRRKVSWAVRKSFRNWVIRSESDVDRRTLSVQSEGQDPPPPSPITCP